MVFQLMHWLSLAAVTSCPLPPPMVWDTQAMAPQDSHHAPFVVQSFLDGPAEATLNEVQCPGVAGMGTGEPSQRHWRLINPASVPAGQSWGLRVPTLGLRDLCVFWPTPALGWEIRCSGEVPAELSEGRLQSQSLFIAPSRLDPARPVLLTARSLVHAGFSVEAGPAEVLVQEQTRHTLFKGAAYGSLLALVIYGLLLMLSVRSLGLLAYSAFIGFFTAALFFAENLHQQWLGLAAPLLHIHGTFLFLGLAFAVGTVLLQQFLRQTDAGPISSTLLWLIGGTAAGLEFYSAWKPELGLILGDMGTLLFASGGLALSLIGMRKGKSHSLPLLAGFSFLMAALLLNSLFRFGWLPNPGLASPTLIQLGLLGAGFCLGLAAQREFRQLRKQRDRASLLAETHHRIARHRAEFDLGTGLPGRQRFYQILSERVANKLDQADQEGIGLLLINLEGVRRLRHIHGSEVCDDVLRAAVKRLQGLEISGRVLARTDRDEFALLLPLPAGEETAKDTLVTAAKSACEQMREAFQIEHREIRIEARAGASLVPHAARGSEELLRQAEVAAFKAREGGESDFVLFGQEAGPELLERWAIRDRLLKAIDEQTLDIHFQPIMSLGDQRIRRLEVLARWTDERLGQVSPAIFIPVAESFGLIGALTRCVVDQACAQTRRWQEEGILQQVTLSVNLSPLQLRDAWLEEWLLECVDKHGLHPSQLHLELTENSLVENLAQARQKLQSLAQAGFGISVDDFGVGYSSLSYIRELPIDTIKIDRSFLARLDQSSAEREIVGSVLSMADKLGLAVVAEGIETESQLSFLKAQACPLGQGFLLGYPAAAEATGRDLRRNCAVPRRPNTSREPGPTSV